MLIIFLLLVSSYAFAMNDKYEQRATESFDQWLERILKEPEKSTPTPAHNNQEQSPTLHSPLRTFHTPSTTTRIAMMKQITRKDLLIDEDGIPHASSPDKEKEKQD